MQRGCVAWRGEARRGQGIGKTRTRDLSVGGWVRRVDGSGPPF